MLNRIELSLLKSGGICVFQEPNRVVFTFNNAEDAHEMFMAYNELLDRKYRDNED